MKTQQSPTSDDLEPRLDLDLESTHKLLRDLDTMRPFCVGFPSLSDISFIGTLIIELL